MEFQILKRSHLKRNIIIGVLVIVLISAIILNFTRAKYRVTQSIPLVNGTINYSLADLNIVAIYTNSDSGYIEVESIPETGYKLNENESYCEVNNVRYDSISLSYDTKTKSLSVTPMTTKGTKCYLYFDESSSAIDIIEGLYPNNQSLVYDEANNLRYIGSNPNNYVYFNCNDYTNPSSSTCELWRIIGIFNEDSHGISNTKLIKLIRSESIGEYAWDQTGGQYGSNDWSGADLQESLNGSYLNGSTFGSGKGITTGTKDMIETVTWKLGAIANDDQTLVANIYNSERNSNSATWNGKIALMYTSDSGYATSGGSTTNRTTCLSNDIIWWQYTETFSDCFNNDWLLTENSQWTLTTAEYGNVFYVDKTFVSDIMAYYPFEVRPSIYLKANIAISGGVGTRNNPYTLIN